jgi:Asp-tRNA(Asn)/Glu-tRNA(Gln) amidotransferase C subunit
LRLHAGGDALRDDTPREGLPREQALDPAPDQTEGLFRVPRILP